MVSCQFQRALETANSELRVTFGFLEMPLITCLKDEPVAYEKFLIQTDSEKNAMIEWIY